MLWTYIGLALSRYKLGSVQILQGEIRGCTIGTGRTAANWPGICTLYSTVMLSRLDTRELMRSKGRLIFVAHITCQSVTAEGHH
jgi:hypothetical protein